LAQVLAQAVALRQRGTQARMLRCTGEAMEKPTRAVIFQALYDGDIETVKTGASTFDWHGTSEEWGTPLLAVIAGNCFDPFSDATMVETKLKLISWCISQGADPYMHAPPCCSWRLEVGRYGEVHEILGGNSAVSIVCNLLNSVKDFMDYLWYEAWEQNGDGVYQEAQEAYARLQRFQKFLVSAERGPAKTKVLEGVANLWEKIYKERASADVVFVCEGTNGLETRECCAHSLVLKAASPVLSAMLDSEGAWQEGQHRRIKTEDSAAVIEHFISLVYTGCFAEGQTSAESADAAEELIDIAEVAQRYQVDFLIAGLLPRLRRLLSDANFDLICGFALRHGEKDLQRDCRECAWELHFRHMSEEAWEAWFGSLSPRVRTLVNNSIGLQTEKRRRRTL